MIDITWSAAVQIVEWGQKAYASAQKKAEQRYARIVENSALIVSGVATLNRQLNELLRRLMHAFEDVHGPATPSHD